MLSALLLGGAGPAFPLTSWLIDTLGLAVLAIYLPRLRWRELDGLMRAALLLVAAMALLCLAQVVPLPAAIWRALPGHALAAQVRDTAQSGGWNAWSLAPDRTLSALAALAAPAAALVLAARTPPAARRRLLRPVLVVAALSAAFAVLQVATGPNSAPVLFGTAHRGFGVGLFVNRNHFALFLLIALVIAALPGVLPRLERAQDRKIAQWGLRAGAFVLLTLGVLATLSRTGVFLLPVALASAILISQRARVRPLVLLAGAGAAALFALVLRTAAPVAALLERFATVAEDKRFEYWGNTALAVRESLPLGTGLGSFTYVYPTYEPLGQVRFEVVNHAHSDLLELALEGGVPALLLLAGWLVVIALAIRHARKRAQDRYERLLPLVVAVATGLALAASATDYPLRMRTISVVLALLVGLVLPSSVGDAERSPADVPLARRALIGAPLAVVALYLLANQWALQLAILGAAPPAARLAPWSADILSAAATGYEIKGDASASSDAARKALRIAPLDAASVRAEGLAALELGRRQEGAALMSLGARLGWRDRVTQLWLIEQAIAANASGFAVQRIDALLRQGVFGEQLLPYLPRFLQTADGRDALAEQLSDSPGWRAAFLYGVARDRAWTMPQLLDLLSKMRTAGAAANSSETALIRASLADAGRFDDSRRVWLASGGAGLIGDPQFEEAQGEVPGWSGPYVWRAPALPGVRVDVSAPPRPDKGNAVAITSEGVGQGTALAQTLALGPGRYTLELHGSGENPGLVRSLDVAIVCHGAGGRTVGMPSPISLAWQATPNGWQMARGGFEVAAGCAGQDITIGIRQSGGRSYTVWLDGVSIRAG